MIGGLLQANTLPWRESAQDLGRVASRLANGLRCRRLDLAVAVSRKHAATGSLNRYPSPDGRSALPLCTPPIFSLSGSVGWDDRRSLAHGRNFIGRRAGTDLGLRALMVRTTLNRKGLSRCRLPNGSPLLPVQSHSLRVAIRRWSRALSAPVQVPVRPSFWMATPSQALSWAVRPTSCTASATPRAAEACVRLTPRRSLPSLVNHRTALRPGGFLLSEEPSSAGQRPRGQEPEGT